MYGLYYPDAPCAQKVRFQVFAQYALSLIASGRPWAEIWTLAKKYVDALEPISDIERQYQKKCKLSKEVKREMREVERLRYVEVSIPELDRTIDDEWGFTAVSFMIDDLNLLF